ncbi:unnamed protein product [Callosobruchus maculatus]|uniref:Large ribosomal subunit protein uL16m n=1 Tax=Callosobruchus maculatus TaxID=64391 RepID=A0A653BG87_CALMS|nr:unnamed protein product [Callosobruchus maculatus]
MNSIRTRGSILPVNAVKIIQVCGFKHFGPPEKYDHVEFPERPRLKVVDRQPQLPPSIRPPKMQKKLRRKMDQDRMFAIWRVDNPWFPVTKKGQGQRMGGGKGAIDHYVTPVKAGRIIVELGGKCEFLEVKDFLQDCANKLPFKAIAVSQKMLDDEKAKEKWELENNQNPYTMKYLIQNNMGGCQRWISPLDFKYFCKYVGNAANGVFYAEGLLNFI